MANTGILARCLAGEVNAEYFVERIRKEDPRLHAWVETRLESHSIDGPLKGVPYGAKDIVETRGYRTTYGSPLFADHVSTEDAALIELLRSKGALLLGKTQTTSFAYFDPAPTRNPHKPDHTPGGSSSGSAAAVATGMAPFAIGTQTQGSIIRPASFCGVVGIKPTFDLLPTKGIMPFAPSLDTAGFFTQTALDLRLLWQALGFVVDSELPPVFAMIESPVDLEMQETFREAVQILSHYGCVVKRVTPPESFEQALNAVRLIQTYEGARTLEETYNRHGAAVGKKLAQLIRDGLAMPEERYREALDVLVKARREMAALFETYPVLLSPAAPGPAPFGLGSTGDPRCNAAWTGLHVPVISIPMPVAENLLPMGLQMAAAAGRETLLIATACHCQALLTAGSAATKTASA
ncbi:MAG: amidase [Bryobacterales bacterium]|nr:amidase [Bryobacterales bacterium]